MILLGPESGIEEKDSAHLVGSYIERRCAEVTWVTLVNKILAHERFIVFLT